MEDPATYLVELGVELTSALGSGGPAVLVPDHRSRVNHENYFFASREEKARFDAEPGRFAGLVTDPVSRVRFRPREHSPRLDWVGRPFFFASESTFAAFRATPDSFLVPRLAMLPRSSR